MSDQVYKKVEIVGTSKKGIDDAIQNAIETATGTIRNIGWFEVVESTGRVVDGKITQFQVTLKIGFKFESD
jgi:flavin-binding protein dodecin